MNPNQVWIAERPRLIGLAYRVLGSWYDAEDVVSEVWLRLNAQEELSNPRAWLTTVTTRLAIDRGRQLRARREDYVGPWLPEPVSTSLLPEESAELRSSLRLGMLRLMDGLEPEERAILVLREAFELPYAEIAATVGRSPAACRQVVSRTKKLLPALTTPDRAPDGDSERALTALVDAVMAGDMDTVLELLTDDCILWSDANGQRKAARWPIYGAEKVARMLVGVTAGITAARPEVKAVNGGQSYHFTWPDGAWMVTLELDHGLVAGLQIMMNPAKLEFIG